MNGGELGFRAYRAWGVGCIRVYNGRQCGIKRQSLIMENQMEIGLRRVFRDCKYLDLRN